MAAVCGSGVTEERLQQTGVPGGSPRFIRERRRSVSPPGISSLSSAGRQPSSPLERQCARMDCILAWARAAARRGSAGTLRQPKGGGKVCRRWPFARNVCCGLASPSMLMGFSWQQHVHRGLEVHCQVQ